MKHTELTDDLQERASLYAAGAMTDTERLEYARHLDEDECAVCRSEVNELQSAISLLAFTAPAARPSPGVKIRLMEQARRAAPVIERPQRSFGWQQWLTAAFAIASLAVAFAITRSNSDLRHLNDVLNSRIAQLEVQLAEQRNNVALLTKSDRVVDLAGQGTNLQARGRIFWDVQRKRWTFYVQDLPTAPSDKSYQLWFVPKSGKPVSASVFNTEADGSARIEVDVPGEVADLKAAAVTTEPRGGLPQPSGAFALLGAL